MSGSGRAEDFTIRLEDEELAALERYAAAHGIVPAMLGSLVRQMVLERVAIWGWKYKSTAVALATPVTGADRRSELEARIDGARGPSGLVNGPRHEVLRMLAVSLGEDDVARRLRVSSDVMAGWMAGWRSILGEEWIGIERLARDYLEGVLHGPS